MTVPSQSYLFLVERPSAEARRAVARRLREMGATVVAEYGDVAVEALVTPEQVEGAREGTAATAVRGPIGREHRDSLGPEARRVVDLWNARFTNRFRKVTRDTTNRGKSWGAEGFDPPLPYSAIDPAAFLDLVRRVERERDITLLPREDDSKDDGAEHPRPMTPKQFVDLERRLRDRYDDETLAYHLARLGWHLKPSHRAVLLELPDWLIDLIWELLHPEDGCWSMTGEMSVGIVFVESSRKGGPRFTASERNDVCNEIITGLNWLASEHPAGGLTWVYDVQFVSIDVADGTGDPDEQYWRDPAMAEVTYDGNTYTAAWSSVAEYREDMRVHNRSDHAFVVFATPYANSWHAYAGSGRLTLARHNNWGGWGIGTLDIITAHEISHLFGAADEYTGSGTPCSTCGSVHGCDNIPNGNCGSCASPQESCAMDENGHRLCSYTRGHIGWSDIFVELRTADEAWAGTDDDVWLDIGDHVFTLDVTDIDDRERGNVQGYAIWAPWLRREDIKRILIRKSPDGFAGGWKLARIRVWFRGDLICDQSPNRWLEDEGLTWSGCVFDRDYVNTLRVKVTTADEWWAGTDDDVTLTVAGRSFTLDNAWHDDFERGNTDTFTLDPGTGLRRSQITSIQIHKSPDGFAGGWKLKGVELSTNGTTIYDNQGINQWLEDNHRTWVDSV